MNKFYLFCAVFFFLLPLSGSQKIRRTFSSYPRVDELKHALVSGDGERIEELMEERFPEDIHAQYVFLGLSDKQNIRNTILNEIFSRWSQRALQNPKEALTFLLKGLRSLLKDYRTNVDQGFLEMLSRLQVALIMNPEISQNGELRAAVLKISPVKNMFMTAYVYAIQNNQAQNMRSGKEIAIARSRPSIAAPWPLGSY